MHGYVDTLFLFSLVVRFLIYVMPILVLWRMPTMQQFHILCAVDTFSPCTHTWTRFVSVFFVTDNLSSFMTYHYIFKMSSTTGANSVSGTDYHPVLPAFNLCFSCRSVLNFLFCVVFCEQLIIFVLFSILTVVLLSVLYIFKIF
jgi:hypothetical protein